MILPVSLLRGLVTIVFLLNLATSAYSEEVAEQTADTGKSELELQVVSIAFPNPELAPRNVIEFGYLFNKGGLQYLFDSATGFSLAGVYAEVILYDSANVAIDTVSQMYNVRSSGAADSSMKVANRLRLAVLPGVYRARVTVMDLVSKEEVTKILDPLPVHPVSTDQLAISGLEVAHSLTSVDPDADSNNPLIKNGRLVTPNPLALCSVNDTTLSLYAEIYNLKLDSSGRARMGIRVELAEVGQEFPYILDESFTQVSGSSVVYAKSLALDSLKPGKSMLRMIVTDANARVSDTSARVINVFDPSASRPFAAATGFGLPYDTFSHQTRMDLVYWVLSPRQRDLLESLNEYGQSQFIAQFWSDNDPEPLSDGNTFFSGVLERFEYANHKYSHLMGQRDGWNTDPGRVLLQYGMPDEIIEVPAPTISNDVTDYDAWERWNYDRIQGGIYFIFANARGYSEYLLRHSNAQGENFDRSIEAEINQVFRSSGG